ncbi:MULTISPECIES: DUF4407 domain-containing protein [Saccharothrix]|uniref:DUF4407 domain-containing protein n=1 Tax=Saccharothrix TaxID=2071 RepID=UPI0009658C39|nr:DUF4407 domain-containing protein [Saccharothrix sp. CB00851]OKI18112.1 hypothetical protein A6A25_11055 [Saccharothrix sp. CB00851]
MTALDDRPSVDEQPLRGRPGTPPIGTPPVDRPVRASLPNDVAIGALRPVMPQRGIPRLLRRTIGVNEDVLDWVPEERPRYTRLGLIVLNTGLLAAVSMHMALASVLGGHWWLVFADLVWAVIIVTADSWLIASTHGAARTSLLGTYLPRLLLSVLLGVVIAEPLVLAVFHQSIDNEISETRKADIDAYGSAVKRCNPPTGEISTDPSCAGFLVVISERPQSAVEELGRATAHRDQLATRIGEINAQLNELERLARDECAGRGGPGLTAIPGEGPECTRNREKADQFRRDSQVDQLNADLVTADRQVSELTTKVANASSRAEREVNAAINAKIDEKRENLTERGLLDEFEALASLSSKHFSVLMAHVFLALLLVVLDCLPVLSKMMSASTEYDARVRRQLDVSGRLHDLQLRASEKRDSVDFELQELRFRQKLRTGIEEIGGEDRTAKARRRMEVDAQIDRLAATLEKARTPEPR